jgi:hypothetical protein
MLLKTAWMLILFTLWLAHSAWGNFEALVLVLVIATFLKHHDRTIDRRLKLGLALIWAAVFVAASFVATKVNGPQTHAKRALVRRLYDFNCSAPFPTYRYPRPVVWLSNGDRLYGSWRAVLKCGE